jgi:Ca2+-binding RTX toxin-like protein
MNGGPGNDTYLVDNAGDTIIEGADGPDGYDTVYSYVSYTLPYSVELLVLLDGGTAVTAEGSEDQNQLVGNSADNILNGHGGNDYLRGGDGNDILFGESGADLLDGEGGADDMRGGDGYDTYMVSDPGDTVTELANEGYDTVYASCDLTLGASSEVEVIYLYNLATHATGSDTDNQIVGALLNDVLSGMGGNDYLRGADGDDVLDGGAGADLLDGGFGHDTLTGGAGADIFQISSPAQGGDRITDFQPGVDHIALGHTAFELFAQPGSSLAGLGVVFSTTGPQDDFQRILMYNPVTGELFWDADGKGASPTVLIATFDHAPTLGLGDFFVGL